MKGLICKTGTVLFILPSVIALLTNPLRAQVDLSVTKSVSPASPVVNHPFTYTITLNVPEPGGPGIVLTDTLPGGIQYQVYPPVGQEIACSPITGTIPISSTQMVFCYSVITPTLAGTFPIRIVAIPMTTGVITNTVEVSRGNDPNPSNNLAVVPVLVAQDLPPVDVSVAKTGPSMAMPGQAITYTVSVNLGSGALGSSGLRITDTINTSGMTRGLISGEMIYNTNQWSCAPVTFTLASGMTQTIVCNNAITFTGGTGFGMRVVPSIDAAGNIQNSVVGRGSAPDPNSGNNSSAAGPVLIVRDSAAKAIPALRDWGLLLMIFSFGGITVYLLKKRKWV